VNNILLELTLYFAFGIEKIYAYFNKMFQMIQGRKRAVFSEYSVPSSPRHWSANSRTISCSLLLLDLSLF